MLSEKEAEAYLKEVEKSGSILGLASIKALMEELFNIQDTLKIIHVAGTNGKGSVCAMLNAIFIEAGYRVGKYTSPAVFEPEERYQINGKNITAQEFAAVITRVKEACDRMKEKGMSQPTIFEVETAAAFLYFYEQECDVVILETGMGGATDATNIIRKSLVSVITSISREHMSFLGNTLEEIAAVKAGIIKEHGVVIAVKRSEQVRKVIAKAAKEKQAHICYADAENAEQMRWEEGKLCFSYKDWKEISLGMAGAYQAENAVCVIETIKYLNAQGFCITPEQGKQGLKKAVWEGRFSVLSQEPLIIMDGAHNEDAAKKLRQTLEMGFTNQKIIYIIGVLADKEHEKMLEIMLPLAEKVFTVTPDNVRALSGQQLEEEAKKYHSNVQYVPETALAVKQAAALAEQEDAMVLVFGSLSYLADIKNACKERKEHDR